MSDENEYGSYQPIICYHKLNEKKEELVPRPKDVALQALPSAQPKSFIYRKLPPPPPPPPPPRLPRPSRQNPYDPFFVPPTVLTASGSLQSASTLASLPTEVLTRIFHHVKIPCYQVCFALTCKIIARVASYPNAMADWRGGWDKEYLFILFQKPHKDLLTKNYYIPPHFRLCRACFRYWPIDAHYWKGSEKCPECFVERYGAVSSPTTWMSLSGLSETRFDQERVCPDLAYRMNKP